MLSYSKPNARLARLACLAALLAPLASGAQPNPYRTLDGWLQAPAGRVLGNVSSVDPDSQGNLWIAERCGANDCSASDLAPIFLADASGRVLASFGASLFAWPHGIYVDADDNVWITDARAGNGRGHQVVKLSSAST